MTITRRVFVWCLQVLLASLLACSVFGLAHLFADLGWVRRPESIMIAALAVLFKESLFGEALFVRRVRDPP